ncbi:MAG: hypothetical protein AAFV49_00435 [Pseudomonadota bacterium]
MLDHLIWPMSFTARPGCFLHRVAGEVIEVSPTHRSGGETDGAHRSPAKTPDQHLDPLSPVMTQDACFTAERIDYERWSDTASFPLLIENDGRRLILRDKAECIEHLKVLEKKAHEIGVCFLRTRIFSHVRPRSDMAILCSFRDRLSAQRRKLGSTSITWVMVQYGSRWYIKQIYFNDVRFDPSVLSYVLSEAELVPPPADKG